MGKEANNAAVQSVEYLETPRPGSREAPTTAKLKEEMKFTAPRNGETEIFMDQLTQDLYNYYYLNDKTNQMMITPEPPNTKIIANQCALIAASQDAKWLKVAMRQLGKELTYTVSYLDPKPYIKNRIDPAPPEREVNLKYFIPIHEAILKALDNPIAAQNTELLVSEGFQQSMLTASNHDFLDAIFNLSTAALDKCVAAKNDKVLTDAISSYATNIGERPVWDLRPYMTRLQEKYLK